MKYHFNVLAAIVLALVFSGTVTAATFTVTKTADTNDGACNADCSLREAIAAANQAPDSDVIQFDPVVFSVPRTITLNGTELTIDQLTNLTINGPGSSLLTISGNNLSRVIRADVATLTINNLKIVGGRTFGNDDGAGLLNQAGTVDVTNVIFENNVSASEGGAIYNVHGNLTITGSTFTGNRATSEGGAIDSDTSTSTIPVISITNSTFSGNSSTNFPGGAIAGFYTLTVVDSTFTNNTAPSGGAVVGGSFTNVSFNSNTAQALAGGALLSPQSVTNCTFNGNFAAVRGGALDIGEGVGTVSIGGSTFTMNGAGQDGGAIYNFRRTLVVVNSRFSNNNANRDGGAYFQNNNSFSPTSFEGSTINSNTASRNGGGIFSGGGAITFNGSTVNSNIALAGGGEGGGGFYLSGGTQLTATNSTISANSSNRGGGVFNRATLSLLNVTVSTNTAVTDGAGVLNFGSNTVNAKSTIIADNVTNNGLASDFLGTLNSQGYNLIESTADTTITGITSGNILGMDAQLAPLRNNGGPTLTVALHPTSPAIDAADPANFPTHDQRGVERPQDGDLNESPLPDMGAYEVTLALFTVTKTADTNDGACDIDCSLREAVQAAGVSTLPLPEPHKVIVFEPALFGTPQTISLSLGELAFVNTGIYRLLGAGREIMTISGNNLSRVFSVGVNAGVRISDLTVANGNGVGSSSGQGGALRTSGWLSLHNMVIRNSSAAGSGGGVYLGAGNLSIANTAIHNNSAMEGGGLNLDNLQTLSEVSLADVTVHNNSAEGSGGGLSSSVKLRAERTVIRNNNSVGDGGGLFLWGRSATLVRTSVRDNSTMSHGGGMYNSHTTHASMSDFSGNSAGANGGGIYNFHFLTLENSTVANNSSDIHGGGIFNASPGDLSVISSTVAGNAAEGVGGGILNTVFGDARARNSIFGDNTAVIHAPDFDGSLVSEGYNLIENTTGTTITGTTTGNILGQDAGLSVLLRGDDVTFLKKLLPGSPAIDAGSPTNFPATDQRGVNRPKDGDGNGSAIVDIGAVERDPVLDTTAPFDFDGDGKTDIGIFRPSVGEWWYQRSSDGLVPAFQFGATADRIVPADYTGDGKTDIAFFRPSTGEWYILRSEDLSFYSFPFGAGEDIPVPADHDADGKADPAVFRPSTATWYIQRSSDNGTTIAQFGATGDHPVAADYDGDGKADLAIYRPSNGQWWLNRSTAGVIVHQFGDSNDKPVQGDYTGDGKADVAFWRPSSGEWYILRSEDNSYYSAPFGTSTDIPAPGDYDGDGKFDTTVFRPSSATWFSQRTTAGTLIQQFGATGDTPIPNAFVR